MYFKFSTTCIIRERNNQRENNQRKIIRENQRERESEREIREREIRNQRERSEREKIGERENR